ncbi:hypothetical protein B296_00051103 [Ensete ventricosum]|uniref:Uncharacterized protein n=1 Tax=Ensete ventricosum TaxID=4639 RepID=A0A426Y9Q3_ENSVE|nr:hypothetical protein B296_00051103 [Ensete ventricosum]
MGPTAAAIASPAFSFVVVRSFHNSCPALDPLLHRYHRCTPPLCLIVTISDLRPVVPFCPSSDLLQPAVTPAAITPYSNNWGHNRCPLLQPSFP